MKILLVLPALVTLTAASISLVPEDNSHYVEGESRYVWVPYGDGKPVLVDLHESVDEAEASRLAEKTQFWLFTRRNSASPQILGLGNAVSVRNSNYNGGRPLAVIIHGFGGSGNSEMSTVLRSAWLNDVDSNVIVVDWGSLANSSYVNAVNQVPNVGRIVSNFITWLFNTTGGQWSTLHITGLGLGGQIAGNAGRLSGGRPRRVTGLDPMSPTWFNNENAIGRNAGQYVEIIHTSLTISNLPLIGHADFYVNGGSTQPGCKTSICSHYRAFHLMASTLRRKAIHGKRCVDADCTELVTLPMGNSDLNKSGYGIFTVKSSTW